MKTISMTDFLKLTAVVSFQLLLSNCASITKTSNGTLDVLISSVESDEKKLAGDMAADLMIAPTPFQKYINENRIDGTRSQVLNEMEASIVALEIGIPKYASRLLGDAYNNIDAIYADNESAKAARSVFVPEANKEFKGEPYERSMVGYYLGLSDLMLNDLENARVSFKWGEFQDSMSASETYQSDMAFINMLIGWTYQCDGQYEAASEYYRLAGNYNQKITLPEKDSNVLFIAETGTGPIKYAEGQYQEKLKYMIDRSTNANRVEMRMDGKAMQATIAEDIFHQASTLGGRQIDSILAGKAQFKDNAETISQVSANVALVSSTMALSAYGSGNSDMANSYGQMAGLSSLISMGANIMAANANPKADTRYWDNLPGLVFTSAARVDKIPDRVEYSFVYGNGRKFVTDRVSAIKNNQCITYWGSDRSVDYWNPAGTGSWVALDSDANQNVVDSLRTVKQIDSSDVEVGPELEVPTHKTKAVVTF